MVQVGQYSQLAGVKTVGMSGYLPSPLKLFKGLGALFVTYMVCEIAFKEMSSLHVEAAPSSIGNGALAFGGFAAARQLLSLNGTGQGLYPLGTPYDSGLPIEGWFSTHERNNASVIGLTGEPFIDGFPFSNARITSVFAGETAPISSGRFGPEPADTQPHKNGQVAKGAEGNFGLAYYYSIPGGGSQIAFSLRDADRAEISSPDTLFSDGSALEYQPVVQPLPNGNFVVGVVTVDKMIISIRNGNVDGEGAAGVEIAGDQTTISAHNAAVRVCSIAVRADNSFTVALQDNGKFASANIRLMNYDASGNPVAAPASFAGSNPKVIQLPSGNSAVFYISGTNLMQKEFSSSGSAFSEVATRIMSTRTVTDYDVEKRSDGCFTLAISDGEISVQPLTTNGTKAGIEISANGGLSAGCPRLANMGDMVVLGFKNATNAIFQIFRKNRPPVASPLGNITLFYNESETVDLTGFRTDMDEVEEGESVLSSLVQGPPFTSVLSDALFVNPTVADTGSVHPIRIDFTDEMGQIGSSSGFLNIGNYPPFFRDDAPISRAVQEGVVLEIPIPGATDPEGGVNSFILEGHPIWASINGGNIRLAPPVNALTTSFNLVAVDPNGGRGFKEVTATVIDDPAPIFDQTGVLPIAVDEGVSLNRDFPTVLDNGPLTYSISGAPDWVTTVTDGLGTVTGYVINPPLGTKGTFSITFHAVDDLGQETTREGQITVRDVPPPTFQDPTPITVSVVEGMTKQVALPAIQGEKAPFTYTFAGSPPSWAEIVNGKLVLNPPDGDAGSYSFTVVGRDQLGQNSPPLSVYGDILDNQSPLFAETTTISQKGTGGKTTFYDLPKVYDDGGEITWSFETTDGTPLPPWVQITSNGYSIAPPEGVEGEFALNLVATDSQGLTGMRRVEFEIDAPPISEAGEKKTALQVLSSILTVLGAGSFGYRIFRFYRRRHGSPRYDFSDFLNEGRQIVSFPFRYGYYKVQVWRGKILANAQNRPQVFSREPEEHDPGKNVEMDRLDTKTDQATDPVDMEGLQELTIG